jgi:hypothetical protein
MWQVIKYELKYNSYYIILLTILFFTYTILSILDFQLTNKREFEIDYWGGIYSLIVYIFLFSVWGTRIKEKRIRLHSLLPITQSKNSLSRFWFAGMPFIVILFYLIIVNLIIVTNWHAETGSMIGQIGIAFTVFAGFIKGRDDWFSHWNLGKRYRAAFVTVFIIQIIVVFIFTGKPGINEVLVNKFGPDGFHYASLIFTLLGFVILVTTIFSFRKRRSYLN